MIRRSAWHPVKLESVQLVAGYRAARHLQALELPPRLSKEVANFICRVEGELAERKIPAAGLASAPESYEDMSDTELAGQARALRLAIITLPASSPRRDVLAQEWQSRMDELARRDSRPA